MVHPARRTSLQLVFLSLLTIFAPLVSGRNPQDSNLSITDQFLVLVPVRDVAEIQRDFDAAEQFRLAAVEAQDTATQQRSDGAKRVEQIKSDIASNKERRAGARVEKNAAAAVALEREGENLERQRNLLNQRQELRDAEINLAKMRVELATLTKQQFDLERQLAMKRMEWSDSSGDRDSKMAQSILSLERDTLNAQKKVADKQGQVADGSKNVVNRQLKTLEAQRKLNEGD